MKTGRTMLLGLSVVAAAQSGCGSSPDEPALYEVSFAATVGDKPFSCAESYDGLGMSKTKAEPLDFRMYIHDVRLVLADGTEAPLELEQDGKWQRDSLALLDFEDGSGACKTGSPETRTMVRGYAAEAEYTGVRFKLGVPAALNHFDAATAPAPLNVPGLWWAWKGGYKFVRMDFKTTGNDAYFFHLGSTTCEGTVKDGFTCAYNNIADISLEGFKPRESTVMFDVAMLYEVSDLDRQIDNMTDFVSGCMAFEGDPECPAVFERLGMKFESAEAPASKQSVFRVE